MPELPSADDLDGRTALLLLIHLSSARRVLFMLSASEGLVTGSPNTDAALSAVRLAPDVLPFARATFDSVVLDIDSDVLRQTVRAGALREVHRVLRPGGRCVIAASNRRIPRDWWNWRQYHLARPDRRWSELVTSDARFTISSTVFARLDRDRIVELTTPSGGLSTYPHDRNADRRIMVLCRSGEFGNGSFVQKLVAELQTSLSLPRRSIRLERFLIRRIGKTTLVMASHDERRYVVRVARTTIAADRGRRNFAALQALQSTHLISGEMKAMVPRPKLAGTIDGYPYYVEQSLPGTARDDYREWPSGTGWEPGALRFISELHLATKRSARIDRQGFDQFVAAPIARIRRRCATLRTDPVFDSLSAFLERAMVGETVPFVWSHGDFSAGNCLYDEARKLSAVVDWELFSDCHLPLLDLLNCMEIRGERNSRATWQRFDRIGTMFRHGRAVENPDLASYVDQMSIPRHLLPALSVMYWVDHVAKRIDARGDDAVWMRKRVFQPLSTLASIELR